MKLRHGDTCLFIGGATGRELYPHNLPMYYRHSAEANFCNDKFQDYDHWVFCNGDYGYLCTGVARCVGVLVLC